MNDENPETPTCRNCLAPLVIEVTRGDPFWLCRGCGWTKIDETTQESQIVQREDDLDDESYQIREIYTRFGLAMYSMQVLEHGLVNILTAVLTAKHPRATTKVFDEAFEVNLVQTMGRLMKGLRSFLQDDMMLIEDLEGVLVLRNGMAHSFFRDHAVDFFSSDGRELMLAKIIAAHHSFENMTGRIDLVSQRFYMQSQGASKEGYHNLVQTIAEKLKVGENVRE